MKKLVFLMISIYSLISFAGDKIGNGGGIWGCINAQGVMTQSELVDLFEARTEFGLELAKVNPSLSPEDIAYQKIEYFKSQDLALAGKIQTSLQEVLGKIRYVHAELEKVDDALYRVRPLASTCAGTWQYIQFANFTAQNQVLIREDIWQSPVVTTLDRASLLIHEAVYRWLRMEYSDVNSIRSRQIVGIIFSTLPAVEIVSRIRKIISEVPNNPSEPDDKKAWFCSIKNGHEHRIFSGSGSTKAEASSMSKIDCRNNSKDGFFCDDNSIQCEKAQSQKNSWFCEVKNTHISQIYSGKGRTQIEAGYHATKSCENASSGNGFFCDHPRCTSDSEVVFLFMEYKPSL